MLVTRLTSKWAKDWLKEAALSNISFISITRLVSKLARGELNAVAPLNKFTIVVTLEVTHPEMSGLHMARFEKSPFMLVTLVTSQCVMEPYKFSALILSAHHMSTASFNVELSSNE